MSENTTYSYKFACGGCHEEIEVTISDDKFEIHVDSSSWGNKVIQNYVGYVTKSTNNMIFLHTETIIDLISGKVINLFVKDENEQYSRLAFRLIDLGSTKYPDMYDHVMAGLVMGNTPVFNHSDDSSRCGKYDTLMIVCRSPDFEQYNGSDNIYLAEITDGDITLLKN